MRTRALGTVLASAVVATALLAPTAAHAAGSVSVRNEQGKAEADTTYSTTITVTGSGFQSVKNAHGGVYVAFGTVSGTWRPSQGGVTGKNYRYVPDTEAKGNKGYLRYVAFPGSDTAASANGGTLKNGRFTTTLTIPGPKFQTYDRNNNVTTVDCLKVRCGVITFGAHGVKNANNETFTPVKFTKLSGAQAVTEPESQTEAESQTQTEPENAEEPSPAAATLVTPAPPASRKATGAITIDRRTAVQGRVMAFTAVGFAPGEQVIAVLDDGVAAVGPIVTGANGELAAAIQVPAGTSPGTHTLRLTAAGSGTELQQNFPVAAEEGPRSSSATKGEDQEWLPWAAAAAAAVLFLLAVAFAVVRTRRLRSANGADHAS
ncbi:hypothetical protein [Aeromicrobium wangtongii]|uniref:Htaa protein n=1 Tax=Aeromicrobium wangtongii TaxID=2969247 RepID=A0ABY5M4B2_9ACTN|nr:hypothetical protein [Aeromicrobium wangtongii]MCD9198952.1 hypothetical protein [Aeromicrobium wangtongii]UUP13010.1 hypothetical protein NQV15_14280 [Aeromicrobium wangtongii]